MILLMPKVLSVRAVLVDPLPWLQASLGLQLLI